MHQAPPPAWPGGAHCAAMLSFDLDGPTLWLDRVVASIAP